MIDTRQNECLRIAGNRAAGNEAWNDFSLYCRNREAGLRYAAFQHLNRFIRSADSWPFQDRTGFADWLCRMLTEFGESAGYGLLPNPLGVQLVGPTLREWAEREPTDSTPCRWMGMYFTGNFLACVQTGLFPSSTDSQSLLREALSRNPNDQLARVRLVEIIVGGVNYSCHHLPQFYIGEPSLVMNQIAEARDLAGQVADPSHAARLRTELDHASQLIGDWISFKETDEDDFAEWCRKAGRNYRWVKAYYYDS